jgi:iron complex transport system substrate-binding protein
VTPATTYPSRIVCLTEETTETLYLLGEDCASSASPALRCAAAAHAGKAAGIGVHRARRSTGSSTRARPRARFLGSAGDIGAELVRNGIEVHVFNQRGVAEILRVIRTLGG